MNGKRLDLGNEVERSEIKAEFELWFRKQFEMGKSLLCVNDKGDYIDSHVNCMWNGFYAGYKRSHSDN